MIFLSCWYGFYSSSYSEEDDWSFTLIYLFLIRLFFTPDDSEFEDEESDELEWSSSEDELDDSLDELSFLFVLRIIFSIFCYIFDLLAEFKELVRLFFEALMFSLGSDIWEDRVW